MIDRNPEAGSARTRFEKAIRAPGDVSNLLSLNLKDIRDRVIEEEGGIK